MEEKPLGQAKILFMPTGEQIPFGEIDDHITPFPELGPFHLVNENPFTTQFTIEFDIKKGPSFRLFNQLVYGWRKLPRKMKKAYKHIKREDPVTVVKRQGEYTIFGGIYYYTIDGYPYTKWVRKVIRKASYEEQTSKRITLEKAIENVLKLKDSGINMFCWSNIVPGTNHVTHWMPIPTINNPKS